MHHAAKVERSVRLQRVIAVLKVADHPLSAEELSVRAYDFGNSKKIILNVSGALSEIRSEANRDAGYLVSDAHSWNGSRYSWHDGRPRYWLIAAPGWMPTWTITTADGEIKQAHGAPAATRTAAAMDDDPIAVRVCKNPKCGKQLSTELSPLDWCCNDECRRQWRESLFPQQNQDGTQSRLL